MTEAPAAPRARTISIPSSLNTWWAERRRAHTFVVDRVPFEDLDGWFFEPSTGNLVHETGRFFTIEGMRLQGDDAAEWSQPIIYQPEVGLLGILIKDFDGVPHCLMQAKMEPGNVNSLQLSPTVQATRSNYTRVHQGRDTRYLEYFRGHPRGHVLVDVLQSEQGTWFWHKHNRNMVVKVTGDVPEHEDFHWVPLPVVRHMLRVDNLINMDSRTVLSCLPGPGSAADETRSLHTLHEILGWFTEMKARCSWRARLVPLVDVARWSRTADEIVDDDRSRFSIVGVRVRAPNREVTQWSQPLLAPRGQGRAVFVVRSIDGVPHALVQARSEPGLHSVVELAPTVQLPSAEDVDSGLGTAQETFLDFVTTVDKSRVLFDSVLSEEGGRFYHAQVRYQIVEAGEDFDLKVADNFMWCTLPQLTELLRHSHYVNVEARTLVACLHGLRWPRDL